MNRSACDVSQRTHDQAQRMLTWPSLTAPILFFGKERERERERERGREKEAARKKKEGDKESVRMGTTEIHTCDECGRKET